MARSYPNADAVGAAIAMLSREDTGKLFAVEIEGGAFEVSGPEEVLALLDAGPSMGQLKAYAAEKRWRLEIGGIVVTGAQIATDDRSKTMIMGARIKADVDAGYTVGWKTAAGFVMLSAAQIIEISDAVLAHVDACFAAEADVLAGIEAGLITSADDIDAHPAWPGNEV